MALDERFSRLLTQDDFDLLNSHYTLDLDYTSAADYRRAQVIWNLHAKCESLSDQLKQKDTEGKRLKTPEN
ncbi:hypothetical protein PBT90_20340 [Algoriphagus halophytocola]|uniref:hypothetical protein n=1 Tax=Algoriphagus halophytocola TaxID=2991499 RepID=UPI0022DCFDA8|nr:hypothetical protein [Algoriphagus sp. TR-M9]WBL42410.1 hypothetical protein PBT90_16865 [Algoriphagus sp. TR-M9]WBL43079.1 hypothetical protein PBT90_20340 [Algoriphagus sp. TR-M9]